MIPNDPTDERAMRCGHNFLFAECPYEHCGARSLWVIYSTLKSIAAELAVIKWDL